MVETGQRINAFTVDRPHQIHVCEAMDGNNTDHKLTQNQCRHYIIIILFPIVQIFEITALLNAVAVAESNARLMYPQSIN